jgi:hypothetical protein
LAGAREVDGVSQVKMAGDVKPKLGREVEEWGHVEELW